MSQLLFGLALVSASLQTGWAVFAEGQFLALPLVIAALLLGVRVLASGSFAPLQALGARVALSTPGQSRRYRVE
jgi:hypothetical protein